MLIRAIKVSVLFALFYFCNKVKQSITLRLAKGNEIKFVKVLKGNGQIYRVTGRDNCAMLDLPADEEVSVKIVNYVN